MRACLRVHELNVYAKPITGSLHRTFQHVANIQLTTNLLEIGRLPLYANAVCRPMTNEPEMRDKSVVKLSVTPSAK